MISPKFRLFFWSVYFSALVCSEAFRGEGLSDFGIKKSLSIQSSVPTPTPALFQRKSVKVELKAPKKKEEEEKVKIGDDATKMFLAYANPIRNPNSIFVYLFMGLYALGKYSEAHPHGVV